MPLDLVVGTQWGDEGKGRIVDLLAAHADWALADANGHLRHGGDLRPAVP